MTITAKQLAEELLKNPDDVVCVTSDNFEQRHQYVPMTSYLYRFRGEIAKQRFRDAFDGEYYTSDIVHTNDDSETWFVKI